MLSRRAYLGTFSIVVAAFSGCGRGKEPLRRLKIGEITTQREGEKWNVTVELSTLRLGPDKYNTFQDVVVHCYAGTRSDLEEVGTKQIGDITKSHYPGNGMMIEIECSSFPSVITYSMDASKCNENEILTLFFVSIYTTHGWLYDRYQRQCGDPLPPKLDSEFQIVTPKGIATNQSTEASSNTSSTPPDPTNTSK